MLGCKPSIKGRPCQLYLKSLPDTLALDEPKLPCLELCLCWDITQNWCLLLTKVDYLIIYSLSSSIRPRPQLGFIHPYKVCRVTDNRPICSMAQSFFFFFPLFCQSFLICAFSHLCFLLVNRDKFFPTKRCKKYSWKTNFNYSFE